MLSVQDLHVYYGAIHALKGVSLTVGDGELVSLIGANGAGKTTTLHTISGLLRAPPAPSSWMGRTFRRRRPMRSSAWGCPTSRRGGTCSPG